MDKVTVISGAAAPLVRSNIDTDTIIRIERLTQLSRDQLGRYAFESLRYVEDGSENPDFVLNQDAYRHAPIVLTAENFGCGSSREGAVWALMGTGVRCVIAQSFGEIFYNNCFQNGLLPVRLAEEVISRLVELSRLGHQVTVKLATQEVLAGEEIYTFEIEPMRRDALLNGIDDVSRTLQYRERIRQWQARDRLERPWIWIVTSS
ncbi:3-isopropylmalate dehydratase small subunit [Paraburkholderia fungorum]|uniref:3-isopropylmalate dehydratase small subunit n=1 Tax=Paraburkholderia fungorum TaxID=134537 RepID=A0A3R7ENE7_9BURK|nr:3-isopropylmalate dehydratase small subunit [Paraburkholderia fungorum]RKF33366.1 3-isopropylmalate dehydratase small subunit [Paraburkholderia fungorum]